MASLKVADLFSGVGGLSQGFISKGFEVAFAIEYDKEISKSYELNHPNTSVINEDIREINLERLKDSYGKIDVIVGGPPCQGFSQKGKRLSINDQRNYLFKRFIDAVDIFRPKYFVLENVPNILSTANGFFKEQIIQGFNELGYTVNAETLNASDFGVPQNRRRAFFLGSMDGTMLPFPSPNNQVTTIKEAIYDLPFIESGEGHQYFDYEKPATSVYQKIMRSGSEGIFNHISTKHSEIALQRLSLIPKGKGKEVLPEEHRTKSIYSGTWSRLDEDGIAATITTRFDTPSSGLFTHPILNRCLTVREAARIQSFPDRFLFYGTKSSQMKQVGNAVPPMLAAEIANIIHLNENK
ncbi:DNA cytosine methyltransferase [Lentiprolixibacter aurantiacus]|uniref:Cytosine-specific methyltransferase n=1 Tax=Lentiprolixibacter aurantiacus TaxID=2993939 RepID=A0AAE3MJS2_9FLAO|nr:DNA cytosine methyltransferase [Lentiprolixibacter aurantiacus]MCX2718758.1 DNA cytosine methyltransferase [Lentiprolixibacter aurantiacus]